MISNSIPWETNFSALWRHSNSIHHTWICIRFILTYQWFFSSADRLGVVFAFWWVGSGWTYLPVHCVDILLSPQSGPRKTGKKYGQPSTPTPRSCNFQHNDPDTWLSNVARRVRMWPGDKP